MWFIYQIILKKVSRLIQLILRICIILIMHFYIYIHIHIYTYMYTLHRWDLKV